jgi:hypothetical protein
MLTHSMAAASPTLMACPERRRLLKAFSDAVSEYNRMHSAQVAAVLRGDDFPFAEEIAAAGRAKEQAKYAVIAHRQEHGC